MATWLEFVSVKKRVRPLRELWKEDSGQHLTEYGLIAALVGLLTLTAMGAFGATLSDVLRTVSAGLSDAWGKVGNVTW
jgi:Flp pilus assembly pilin Flp